MDIPRSGPPDNAETGHQPEDRELTPISESDFSKWAKKLGFESNEEMDLLANEILGSNPDDEYRIKKLLAEYNFRAYQITVDKNKRSAEDSLALILQSAHFHYVKGMFVAVFNEFKEINLALKSPEIDDETYELIGDVIISIRKEIGQVIFVDTSLEAMRSTLGEVLSSEEIEKLYLLAQAKGGN